MIVYALIGRSGSGKSHRAQDVSKNYGIEYIIDDGLLINGYRVLAGVSAKKESTKFAAVRRAVFVDPIHRQEIVDAIKKSNPPSILILGTSDNMVNRIVENLNLPPIDKHIYIEDIAAPWEIELATKTRKEQGKHVIPVPTFAVKKDFSGYFIDSIKTLARRGRGDESDDMERTVVRPTYSYLGKYTIANSVIKSMVTYAGEKAEGVYKIPKVNVKNTVSGLEIDIDVIVNFGYRIQDVIAQLRENVKNEIEYMTAFNILQVNVYVKGLNMLKRI